ncbi:MAG: hypothetical protein ABL998_15175 [Planctomycetota bacterium]
MVIDRWTGGCVGDAIVRPGFARGALLLRAPEGGTFRLSWGEDGGAGDVRRALAPGSYEVLGYRRIERDRAGAEWLASVSGPPPVLELRAGEVTLFAPPALELTLEAGAAPISFVQVGLSDGERGVALYRDGRRIELAYVLTDASGRPLARGPLDYG